MTKINLDNLEPNSDGITIDGRTITVQGYIKDRGIQIFYNQEEKLTNRVIGIDMPDKNHYLVNEADIDYSKNIPNHQYVCETSRAYVLTSYDSEKYTAIGEEISHNQEPQLLDQIQLALARRADELLE